MRTNRGSSPQSCRFSCIDYPIPSPCTPPPNTDCRQSGKLTPTHPPPSSPPPVWRWKALRWSQECGQPPPVQSNHSRASITLPPLTPWHPLPPRPHPTHHPSEPPPHPSSIIPTSPVRELGWSLVALLSLLLSHPSSPAISPPSHPLLPVHWLLYGGWHWANSISRQPPLCRSAPPAAVSLLLFSRRYFLFSSPAVTLSFRPI